MSADPFSQLVGALGGAAQAPAKQSGGRGRVVRLIDRPPAPRKPRVQPSLPLATQKDKRPLRASATAVPASLGAEPPAPLTSITKAAATASHKEHDFDYLTPQPRRYYLDELAAEKGKRFVGLAHARPSGWVCPRSVLSGLPTQRELRTRSRGPNEPVEP